MSPISDESSSFLSSNSPGDECGISSYNRSISVPVETARPARRYADSPQIGSGKFFRQQVSRTPPRLTGDALPEAEDKANLCLQIISIRNTLRCAASTSISCGRFSKVVELGSFSAAARRLNLTQPAVSLQIRELERRFGVRLIERMGKQAHATAPGASCRGRAADFSRVRSRRGGDAPLSRRLDRPRAHRHHQHGADPTCCRRSCAGCAWSIPASTCSSPTCRRATASKASSRTSSISRW